MKIKGKLNEYDCSWHRGISYNWVRLEVPCKVFFGLIPWSTCVYDNPSSYLNSMGLPEEHRNAYRRAISKYEEHKIAWDKENE